MGEIASGYPERSECRARQANGITIPGHRTVQYSPGEDEAVILPRVPPSFLSPGLEAEPNRVIPAATHLIP